MPKIEARKTPVEVDQVADEVAVAADPAEQPGNENVLVELPIGKSDVSFRVHINLDLSLEMTNALYRLMEGYKAKNRKPKTGREVNGPNSALRILLEDVAAAIRKNA